MLFKVPHKTDLSLDGQTMRKQMIENFTAIENEINDIRKIVDKDKQSVDFNSIYDSFGKK